jgi:hypothetical protein
MAVQVQFRRGSAAQWTSANPILAEGELGLELDTGKFKLGNGTSTWTQLSYSSGVQGPTGPAGVAGAAGPAGTGITQVVQTWNSTTFYPKGTVIPYDDNNTYIALQDNTNKDPDLTPTYWAILIRGGSRGATGPAGTSGDTNLNQKVIADAFLGTGFYFPKNINNVNVTTTTSVIAPITLI